MKTRKWFVLLVTLMILISSMLSGTVYADSQYTVTYYGTTGRTSDGQLVYSEVVPEGSVLKESMFAAEGYEFIGWMSSNKLLYQPGVSLPLNEFNGEAIVLYAAWKQLPVEVANTPVNYTLHFDPNGGYGSMPDQAVYAANDRINACGFYKEGHTFLGWLGSNDVTYANGAIVPPVGCTLTAMWHKNVSTNGHRILFIGDSYGVGVSGVGTTMLGWGSAVKSAYGDNAIVKVKSGYGFTGNYGTYKWSELISPDSSVTDVVFICGGNDIFKNDEAAVAAREAIKLCNSCYPGARIYLGAPQNHWNPAYREALNQLYWFVFAKLDGITLIPSLVNSIEGHLSGDGIHPSGTGQAIIISKLTEFVDSVLVNQPLGVVEQPIVPVEPTPVYNKPVISSVATSDVSIEGYKVVVTFSGDVSNVKFPTWSAVNNQDDIVWYKGTVNGNTAEVYVSIANHNNERGSFVTHCYVYGMDGEAVIQAVNVNIPYPPKPQTTTTETTTKPTTASTTEATTSKSTTVTTTEATTNKPTTASTTEETTATTTEAITVSTTENVPKNNGNNSSVNNKLSIDDIVVSNKTAEGYTLTIKFTSTFKVANCYIPTWSANNGQDDIYWYKANIKGNTATCNIKCNEKGQYISHVYLYNCYGDHVLKGINVTIDEVHSNNAINYNGYEKVFNSKYYVERYSDLKNTFGYNEQALWQHFVVYGIFEGRIASSNFNVHNYRNRYVDLQQAFGNNLSLYYAHYVNHGYKEGRLAN